MAIVASTVRRLSVPHHERRLLAAAFTAILATGVGFAIRGGILASWGHEFGFTASELGSIAGAGFTGFTFAIIAGGLVCDKIGYGKLVAIAFVLHATSVVVTLAPVEGMIKGSARAFLYWGTFIFALGNGTLEAAVNPLVATLYRKERSHYLNILHAGWPLGMMIGGTAGWLLGDRLHVNWKIQFALFLVPMVGYGVLFLRQTMPRSEAAAKGLHLGEMLSDVGLLSGGLVCALLALFAADQLGPGSLATSVALGIGFALLVALGVVTRFSLGSILLFTLFIVQALVGSVELGTDGWIQNITGNILSSGQGKLLFVYTSTIMLILRFSMRSIGRWSNMAPVSILLICSLLACVGLRLTSEVHSFATALFALGLYAIGKSFFWPTMLAVTSDRFTRCGAVAISLLGGIGYLAAGVIGSAGLGYAQDRFAGEELQSTDLAAFELYKAVVSSRFLWLSPAVGLDGKKLGLLKDRLSVEQGGPGDAGRRQEGIRSTAPSREERAVVAADLEASRRTLRADSIIPLVMAGIYLALVICIREPRPASRGAKGE